jgi:hypothetical protein
MECSTIDKINLELEKLTLDPSKGNEEDKRANKEDGITCQTPKDDFKLLHEASRVANESLQRIATQQKLCSAENLMSEEGVKNLAEYLKQGMHLDYQG